MYNKRYVKISDKFYDLGEISTDFLKNSIRSSEVDCAQIYEKVDDEMVWISWEIAIHRKNNQTYFRESKSWHY